MSILDTMFSYGSNQNTVNGHYLMGFKQNRQSNSLGHYLGTPIYNQIKNNHCLEKVHSKVSLEDLHQRIRLYSDEGNQLLQTSLPAKQQMLYRQPMILYLLKRLESISEEQLSQPQLRNQLVKWVIKIHAKSKFKFETLYHAVRIVDRYLSRNTISIELYNTLGATALCMAAKLEESITCHALVDWMVKLQGITLDAIHQMEFDILICFNFNLNVPNVYKFFEIASTYFTMTKRAYSLCLYLMELSQLDCQYLSHHTNILALAIIYLSLKIMNPNCWNEVVVQAFSVKLIQIRELSKELLKSLVKNLEDETSYTRKKFSKRRHCCVARMKI